MVIGKLNLGAFPDYKDDCYEKNGNYAIIDYGFLADAYEDILLNLAGELEAKAFLEFTEKHQHGVFIGDGYTIEF